MTPKYLAFAVSSAGTRPCALFSHRIQMEPALSACTLPGSAWARQPKTQSASIWPITWRAVTGDGRVGSTQVPGSVTRSKQESEPILLGTCGAITALRPKTE